MNAALPDRIRAVLGEDPNIAEIRMMGGICFTLNGNMLVGSMKRNELLVRVGAEGMEAALKRPGARVMDFTGRSMGGFVVVSGDVLDDAALRAWIAAATSFVGPMPPRQKKPSKRS